MFYILALSSLCYSCDSGTTLRAFTGCGTQTEKHFHIHLCLAALCYQDNKLLKMPVLALHVGPRGPILEKAFELGESLVSHLLILACGDQMNQLEPVA